VPPVRRPANGGLRPKLLRLLAEQAEQLIEQLRELGADADAVEDASREFWIF